MKVKSSEFQTLIAKLTRTQSLRSLMIGLKDSKASASSSTQFKSSKMRVRALTKGSWAQTNLKCRFAILENTHLPIISCLSESHLSTSTKLISKTQIFLELIIKWSKRISSNSLRKQCGILRKNYSSKTSGDTLWKYRKESNQKLKRWMHPLR